MQSMVRVVPAISEKYHSLYMGRYLETENDEETRIYFILQPHRELSYGFWKARD